jgi:hypothetical protein
MHPVPDALVLIAPAQAQPKRLDLYHSAFADSTGHVQFDGLSPGQYKVFAWRDIDENAWHEAEILRVYEDGAIPLQVREGATQSLQLKAINGWPR